MEYDLGIVMKKFDGENQESWKNKMKNNDEWRLFDLEKRELEVSVIRPIHVRWTVGQSNVNNLQHHR